MGGEVRINASTSNCGVPCSTWREHALPTTHTLCLTPHTSTLYVPQSIDQRPLALVLTTSNQSLWKIWEISTIGAAKSCGMDQSQLIPNPEYATKTTTLPAAVSTLILPWYFPIHLSDRSFATPMGVELLKALNRYHYIRETRVTTIRGRNDR